MQIKDDKLILNAVNAIWVEISQEIYRLPDFKDMKEINIGDRDIWFLGENPYLMYSGYKFYAEESLYESLQKKRTTGYYKAKIHGIDVVTYYVEESGAYHYGSSGRAYESLFEWIDDAPIKF